MQMAQPKGRVAYEPSSLAADSPREDPKRGFRSFAGSEDGARGRVRAASFADHYSQARLFYRSQTAPEQAHIASALVFELSKVETAHVREAMVGHLRHIDAGLARRVADGLGLGQAARRACRGGARPRHGRIARAADHRQDEGDARRARVAILVSDGADGELIARLKKATVAAGASVKIVAPKVAGVRLASGKALAADGQLAGTPSVLFDAVAIIASAAGAKELSQEAAAIDFVRDAFGHLKAIAIDEGGQSLLQAAGVGVDAGIVAAHDVDAFVKAAMTRQWQREAKVRTLA